MNQTVVLAVLALTWGCAQRSTPADASGNRAEGRYRVGDPGEGWRAQRPGGADKAWFHPQLGAAIYTDSNCGRRYVDDRLPQLAKHLTHGIVTDGPLSELDGTLDGRASLTSTFDGRLDGVEIKLGVVVTKKHQCTYDLLLVSPPDVFDNAWTAFESVVQGFAVRRP